MKLSKILLALLTIGVLLGGFLLWQNSSGAYLHNQNELAQKEKVILSSSLEFENQTVEDGYFPPSLPGGLISIEQAIQNVTQKYPGRITRAEFLFGENGPIYEVVVQRGDGAMTVIEVDAETGQVLGPLPDLEPNNYPGQIFEQETEI